MTGPEHYREAELMLKTAAKKRYGTGVEGYYMAAAQVHATLALATALADRFDPEWAQVTK
jgi:hypothetical protein